VAKSLTVKENTLKPAVSGEPRGRWDVSQVWARVLPARAGVAPGGFPEVWIRRHSR